MIRRPSSKVEGNPISRCSPYFEPQCTADNGINSKCSLALLSRAALAPAAWCVAKLLKMQATCCANASNELNRPTASDPTAMFSALQATGKDVRFGIEVRARCVVLIRYNDRRTTRAVSPSRHRPRKSPLHHGAAVKSPRVALHRCSYISLL